MVNPFLVSELESVIEDVRKEQLNHKDPRSLALVITHVEDAILRYEHANA